MNMPTQSVLNGLLALFAFHFNHRKKLRAYLDSDKGPIDFTIAFRVQDSQVTAALAFRDGRVRIWRNGSGRPDTTLIFADDKTLYKMLRISPNEVLTLLMHNKIRTEGNFTYLNLFNFYLSLLLGNVHRRLETRRQAKERQFRKEVASKSNAKPRRKENRTTRLSAAAIDPGVKFLPDSYLPDFALTDFPRLQSFLDEHFTEQPELCPERPKLLTDWFKRYGFDTDSSGQKWNPELRQANAFKYLMENKRPIVHDNDLLAGTTTSKKIGVVIYPDAHGSLIWNELLSAPYRELNPYTISDESVELFHREIFPYWIHNNFREWVREKYDHPLCQQLDERFAVYFVWKSVGISHTIPDFPSILKKGARGIQEQITTALEKANGDPDRRAPLEAMALCLKGLVAYAKNLSVHAAAQAQREGDETRRQELLRIAENCARVPEHPARTLAEAVQSIWIAWIGLHNENTNTGLSLGRLDRWLQPYFEADMAKCQSEQERRAYVHHALDLLGCLFMRCTDHLPLIPDIGNYLFGGASSDQAITLGGVTDQGEDAVCDMTYLILKVTEMLGIRDPNVNARFCPGTNSDTYLRRLCEINLITGATPSLHNDKAVMKSLEPFGYPIESIRDWSATGCVEPTLSGRHMAHTGSILINMVAPLEMALYNGRHPLMNWQPGPDTGENFETFEQFAEAFQTQFGFLIDQATTFNKMLGEAHAHIRPTPLLSSLMDGCIEKGRDVVNGGAQYNSSGAAVIGLADVTDSLMAIKKLVFDEQRVSLAEFREAVCDNFENHAELHARLRAKVPLFGSGDPEALAMANRVTRFAHEQFGKHRNFRGGPYTAGFWSMSNHVAFGTLAGALPSGRLRGKAFTPGLTPQPFASPNLLDNLRDVAGLDPESMANNMAFNIKVVPSATDSHEQVVDRMQTYVRSYFELGGMQMQMNVVTTDTLRDAMANPDAYRNLLVRISGYNAYFVTLNRDLQMELIERAEYGLS